MNKRAVFRTKTERLTVAGMLLAVGIILPYATAHGLGIQGNILLPMHIPVFICGILCGPFWGGMCGIILPLLNSLITSMPALYPNMPMMAAELLVYGTVSGLIYHKTPLGSKKAGVYLSLVISMVCGRIIYGLVFRFMLIFDGDLKAASAIAALVTGLPGIAIQLLFVPGVVFAVEGLFRKSKTDALQSAKNLILSDKATCVVIKEDKIVSIEHGSGIKPVIDLYYQGFIRDAVIVDKIIGKAAAMIMVLGGVRACYGITVSKSAVEYLEKHNVPVEFDKCTEYIVNRKGDGICPMEETVKDIEDAKTALEALKAKVASLSQGK
ncbi:MAG: DUF1893 domain-containing protein [Clostridia bacterium]|nr:DUF1893 domain-containing protein [Clostridia bacterium]